MVLRSIHLIGAFLLLVATVLLIITDITAPVVNNLAIFRVDGNSFTVHFGTFGSCTTNNGISSCSSTGVGYSPVDVIASAGQVNLQSSDASNIEGLTKAMVLHPIATGFNFIAFVIALRPGLVLSLCASLLAVFGSIITLVAMIIDVVCFNMLASDVNVNIYYSTGFATLVAAFILSLLGAIIVLFTCCAGRRKHKAHKHHHSETVTVTTTTTTTNGNHGHASKHKHQRRCFCCRWF